MTKQIFSTDTQSCVILFPLRLYSIAKKSAPGTNDNTATFCTSGPCVVQEPTGLYAKHGVLFNQGAKHATNALLANRAALTQNMSIMQLKTKVSGSTHGTQWTN